MNDGVWVAVAVAIGVVIFLAINSTRGNRSPQGSRRRWRDGGSGAEVALMGGAVVGAGAAGRDDDDAPGDGGSGGGDGGGGWGWGDGGGSDGGGGGGGGDGGGGGGGD